MVTRLTAMVMATRDDLRFDASAKPAENGKYIGWISLPPEDNYRPLINSEPIYDTKEDAIEAMKRVAAECKEFIEKESNGKHPVDAVMEKAGATSDEVDAVKSIVEAASNG